MCLNTWKDDPAQIEPAMLAGKNIFRSTNYKESLPKSEQVWWCPDFNNNKCSYQTLTDQKTILGHPRNVRHICGTYWRTDKKHLKHPESSAACPHKA